MKYTKKFLALLLALILSVGILAGCTPQETVDTNSLNTNSSGITETLQNSGTEEQTNSASVEKVYSTLTLQDDFPVGYVKLIMNPNSAKDSYLIEDFAEVDCLGIMDSIMGSFLKLEPTRRVIVALSEETKEATLSAIKTLEQRDDVLSAEPTTEEYMDSWIEERFYFRNDVNQNAEFIPGSILITLYPSASRKTYTKEDFSDVNCTHLKQNFWTHQNAYTMVITLEDQSREGTIAAAEIIAKREDVCSIYFEHTLTLDAYPETDLSPSDSAYENNLQWAIDRLELPNAWNSTTGSSSVTVGVIDTGIDASHPDLTDRVDRTLSKCFADPTESGCIDENGHGTHVAGIIGAKADEYGMVGTCWNVTLVSLRISAGNFSNGSANLSEPAAIEAIQYAKTNGIDVLNMSCSGFSAEGGMREAIQNYPGLFICSAGNSNKDLDTYTRYPGAFQLSNMIVVGASSQSNGRWYSNAESASNHGTTIVDIFAPGQSIYSCLPGNSYSSWSGTSMATPFVTGVAALVLSVSPNISASSLKSLILNNGVAYSTLSGYCKTGKLLNAYNVLDEIAHVHFYLNDYTSTGSSQHRVYCNCGASILQNHAYTASYSQLNIAYHNAYCKCGAYTSIAHSYTTSGSVRSCTECGFSVALNNTEPEIETQ